MQSRKPTPLSSNNLPVPRIKLERINRAVTPFASISDPLRSRRNRKNSISYNSARSELPLRVRAKLPKSLFLPDSFCLPSNIKGQDAKEKNSFYNIKRFIDDVFLQIDQKKIITYHNSAHTFDDVIPSLLNIIIEHNRINKHELSDEDKEILITAAYAHDIGFLLGESAKGHEERSMELISPVLRKNIADPDKQRLIKQCIIATRLIIGHDRIYQLPLNIYEQIICDADVFNLGANLEEFFEKNLRVLKEAIEYNHTKNNILGWFNFTKKLLQQPFHTHAARNLRGQGRENNGFFIQELIRHCYDEEGKAIDDLRDRDFLKVAMNIIDFLNSKGLLLKTDLVCNIFKLHPDYLLCEKQLKFYIDIVTRSIKLKPIQIAKKYNLVHLRAGHSVNEIKCYGTKARPFITIK
jgi:hypothetical protein